MIQVLRIRWEEVVVRAMVVQVVPFLPRFLALPLKHSLYLLPSLFSPFISPPPTLRINTDPSMSVHR